MLHVFRSWTGQKLKEGLYNEKEIFSDADGIRDGVGPVSYTHLDVYKRQAKYCGQRMLFFKEKGMTCVFCCITKYFLQAFPFFPFLL